MLVPEYVSKSPGDSLAMRNEIPGHAAQELVEYMYNRINDVDCGTLARFNWTKKYRCLLVFLVISLTWLFHDKVSEIV